MSDIEELPDEELPEDQEAEAEAPQDQPQEPQPDPELEAEAAKYGWKPKDNFKRNPEGWIDAAKFLELPSTQVKMTRDINRRLEKELRDRDERLARIEATTQTAVQRIRDQERQAYEAKLAELQAAKRAAVEVGDTAQFDRLEAQQRAIQPPPPVPVSQSGPVPEVKAYLDETKWFKDPDAFTFARELIDANPAVQKLDPMRQVKWAEAQLRNSGVFAHHFEAPAPAKPAVSRVDAGGMGGATSFRRTKGASDLPQDVRAVADSFVKEGIYKSVDEYAADYFGQEIGR